MKELYHESALKSSKVITNTYSTSFSLGIKMLDSSIHDSIYAIYGFVRLADEIVDTFHDQDKKRLLNEFVEATNQAISREFSLNPILHSFQLTVNKYNIDQDLIDAFIKSMEYDLFKKDYDRAGFEEYVYGSAEVVGLMCLKVFCKGDESQYQKLVEPARKLGAAFQKINFLRDLKADFEEKGRSYFPKVDLENFTEKDKCAIEEEIERDFQAGYEGIKQLPSNARFGVYTAYIYYYALHKKIKTVEASRVLRERIRIPNIQKYYLLLRSFLFYKAGIL